MNCEHGCDRLVVEFELHHRPVPKGRPRFGNGRTFTDDKTRAYEARVEKACRAAMDGREPAAGPVELLCLFEQRNNVTADLDNLVKAVSDAIEGVAFLNDRQVVQIRSHRATKAAVDRVSVAVLTATSHQETA